MLFLGSAVLPLSTAASQQSSRETFFANLTAASGVTTKSSGLAEFWLSPDGGQLHYVLIVNEITGVFMAHIHFHDGSIIVWLYPNPNHVGLKGQTACLTNPSTCPGLKTGEFNGVLAFGTITAANLKASDCAGCNGMTFAQLIAAMETDNAYVNVHTLTNPGGEIQGTVEE